MATLGEERELLAAGTEQEGKVRGSWAQNLWENEGTISVRPGWGVVSELDTTLGNNIGAGDPVAADPYGHMAVMQSGYDKHLGSAYVETNFGHEQVVSVFIGTFFPGDVGADPRTDKFDRYFAVRIFDITTNRSWEEILYRYTAEMVGGNKIVVDTQGANHPSEWYGTYESSFEVDNTQFSGADFEGQWFFHVTRGHVYFGSPSSGVFVYRPADFKGYKRQQVNTSTRFDWRVASSESSLISKVHFTDGVFSEGMIYADQNNINKIIAMTSFRGRIVYATDFEIWFSDVNRPNSVIARNFIAVPSSKKVTAMYELMGNLVIFTKDEMFLYIPSEGTIVSQGRPPIKVSESVGCISQQALTKFEESLVWVSSTGVFNTADGRSISELSEDIRSFWPGNGIMTNPMTSYYETNNSWVNINNVTPPRTLIEFDPDRVSLSYSHKEKCLFMSCPNVNGCWTFSGIWSWWPMESSVSSDALGAPTVSSQSNLLDPWVITSRNDVFAICGIDNSAITDASTTIISAAENTLPAAPADVAVSLNGEIESYILCSLGRGGALDRSSDQEDDRLGFGSYIPIIRPSAPMQDGIFYFDEPYFKKDSLTGTGYYHFPVFLVPPPPSALGGTTVSHYELLFQFDSAQWDAEPDASANISLIYATERLVSHSAATAVVSQTTDAAAVPDVAGNHIRIKFDGTTATIPAASWTYQPYINVAPKRKNPLFELRLKKKTTSTVNGIGMVPKASVVSNATNTKSPVPILFWSKTFIGTADSHNNNSKAQAVDWSYKSEELALGPIQLRARGIYALVNSRGRGLQANRIVPNWVWGLYNVILGSDSKDYTSQIIDYEENLQKIEDKTTIRSRLRNVSGDMVGRVFGNSVAGTGNALWGRTGQSTDGNYLIDDQETDEIATSDSVKGSRISYMVFGFMQDRAESLTIQRLTGIFRPGGRRRRTGR